MFILHAVADVAATHFLDRRNEPAEIVQSAHRHCDHGHQFFALFLDVRGEERFEAGIEFKQFAVEQRRGLLGDRHAFFPGGLHEFNLSWGHNRFFEFGVL
jgi:hypothetical protein